MHLVSEVGEEVADREFEALLSSLSHPPSFTCVRVNTHLAPQQQIQHALQQELTGQQLCGCHGEDASLVPLPHPQLPDVLLLPIIGPRYTHTHTSRCPPVTHHWTQVHTHTSRCPPVTHHWTQVHTHTHFQMSSCYPSLDPGTHTHTHTSRCSPVTHHWTQVHTHTLPDVLLLPIIGPRRVCVLDSEVVVGAQCGSSVLRGAHVFAPGVLSAPKTLQVGDMVSVFSDVENKCTRGAKSFEGQKVFLGNGVCEMSRSEVFCSKGLMRGVAVRMTDRLYITPCFDRVLPHLVFLQNLPSVLVSHVLGPRSGECVLDMCAAPGGKTTHIATLMRNQGVVVALDKIRSKVEKLRENAANQQLDCIQAFCCNSIQAVATGTSPSQKSMWDGANGPPFPEGSFDRVLLDAPCSGLGQRPNMAVSSSLKEIRSYQPLQRKLFNTAVHLLKRGGVLVYSTCTVTLAENEEQVAWALRTFPYLTLQPQEPNLGEQGMLGAGLSHDQRRLLQRFHPRMNEGGASDGHAPMPCLDDADSDTIGFFIAKFFKS
ncbi:tRNA (cytosine(72)-C(5))-methyltransferase NSUN6 isoform X3 [Alosa alosa]|uniref:tRNA (cytosine(72)-C(5))-methyltransferase NSUN6 isoform X3 n=1 Tax=Alosa alosa TaxID=278164 RepID=UPI002015460D|nr:tRNA (cytosine(72)-C(5))-methyltransferase NSUN6 isoform X3 [Alosa alosa]